MAFAKGPQSQNLKSYQINCLVFLGQFLAKYYFKSQKHRVGDFGVTRHVDFTKIAKT